jgi:DNA-binding response OmpR family regulator
MTATNDERPLILVVEDDDANRRLLRAFLEREGFEVREAADGPAALQAVASEEIDLVVLDLGLPGIDGLDVLASIRRRGDIPVLVLTGRVEEQQRVQGLDAGADDYVLKPYSLPELAARTRALLRRGQPRGESNDRLEFEGLVIDLAAARAAAHDSVLDLAPKEFTLLAFLASEQGRTFSREELLHHVWGSTSRWQDPATVTEHVRRVRQKLDRAGFGQCIETVRGFGYRFVAPQAPLGAPASAQSAMPASAPAGATV